MSRRQIEMTWVCTSCQGRNLGRFKVCQTCRHPKDGSEPYEMPADPSKAVTVTEESLLRMASAGPDWRCAYCSSDQRRSDRGCANCGASALEGGEVPDEPGQPAAPAPGPLVNRARWLLVGLGSVLSLVALVSVLQWNHNRPRDYQGVVSDVHWLRGIDVERYQARPHEGFKENLPEGALDVRPLGQREHHREDVFDHHETEHDTEQVPDGYRTESYTERVSCGQTCTTRPQSCREKCTSNKNGFATCRTECSGGGQSCSTKYCDQPRTRQVAKTRTEVRTRQVAKYRSEPRFAEAFAWSAWEWVPARSVKAEGTDVTVHWPDAHLGEGLQQGEKEREVRHQRFKVTVSYDGEHHLTVHPQSEDEFARFAPGSKHQVHSEHGTLTLDGAPVRDGP